MSLSTRACPTSDLVRIKVKLWKRFSKIFFKTLHISLLSVSAAVSDSQDKTWPGSKHKMKCASDEILWFDPTGRHFWWKQSELRQAQFKFVREAPHAICHHVACDANIVWGKNSENSKRAAKRVWSRFLIGYFLILILDWVKDQSRCTDLWVIYLLIRFFFKLFASQKQNCLELHLAGWLQVKRSNQVGAWWVGFLTRLVMFLLSATEEQRWFFIFLSLNLIKSWQTLRKSCMLSTDLHRQQGKSPLCNCHL